MAANPQPEKPYRPSVEEFTPELAAMYGMTEMLGIVVQAIIGSSGGKPPKFPASPRPVTGVDRARMNAERAAHSSLVDEVRAAQERWAKRSG